MAGKTSKVSVREKYHVADIQIYLAKKTQDYEIARHEKTLLVAANLSSEYTAISVLLLYLSYPKAKQALFCCGKRESYFADRHHHPPHHAYNTKEKKAKRHTRRGKNLFPPFSHHYSNARGTTMPKSNFICLPTKLDFKYGMYYEYLR